MVPRQIHHRPAAVIDRRYASPVLAVPLDQRRVPLILDSPAVRIDTQR